MPRLATPNDHIVREQSWGQGSVQLRYDPDTVALVPVLTGSVQLWTCKAAGVDLRAEDAMDLMDYATADEKTELMTIFGHVLARIFAENVSYTVVDRAADAV